MREDEERRKLDNAARYEEQQKQYQLERRLLEKELHDAHQNASVRGALAAAAALPAPSTAAKPSESDQPKKAPTLVAGRAQMFDERAAEIARSTPNTPQRPKQFKFQVALQSAAQTPPVNCGQHQEDDFVPAIEDPARPVAHIVPLAPQTQQTQPQQLQNDNEEHKPSPPPPPSQQASTFDEAPTPLEKAVLSDEKRAITLWDYKAGLCAF